MDISEMLVGKSDQLDNIDLMSGPRDFTIKAVRGGNTEQPLNIDLVEFPRPWRPGLTMRRLLAAIWGPEAASYVGKRVRLFRDTEVTFGKAATGGTRLSHASHLDATVTVWLPVSRGQFKEFTVEPLKFDEASQGDAPSNSITPDEVATETDVEALKVMWRAAGPEMRAQIEARVAELNAQGQD